MKLIEIFDAKVVAPLALVSGWLVYTFALGRRIGAVEEQMRSQAGELRYIRERIDHHFDQRG